MMISGLRKQGTSYLLSSVKFIYIADSIFLRHLLVFSIGSLFVITVRRPPFAVS